MITSPAVTKISILSRRAVPQAEGESKCEVIIHKDFASYEPEVMSRLADAHGCVWAQGISQTQVGKNEYYRITHDYPLAFAKALAATPPSPSSSSTARTVFLYISGEGATHHPGALTPLFGRVKGETELELLALKESATTTTTPSSSTSPETNQYCRQLPMYMVRPSAVDASAHAAIQAFVPPPPSGVFGLLHSAALVATRVAWKNSHTPTEALGKACVELAVSNGEPLAKGKGVLNDGRVLSNVGIRRLAGL